MYRDLKCNEFPIEVLDNRGLDNRGSTVFTALATYSFPPLLYLGYGSGIATAGPAGHMPYTLPTCLITTGWIFDYQTFYSMHYAS